MTAVFIVATIIALLVLASPVQKKGYYTPTRPPKNPIPPGQRPPAERP